MPLLLSQPVRTACCSLLAVDSLLVALDSESRDISLNDLVRVAIDVEEGLLVVDLADNVTSSVSNDAVDEGALRRDVLDGGSLDNAVLDEHGACKHVGEGVGDAVCGDGADGVGAGEVVGELDGGERCGSCGAGEGKGRAGKSKSGCDD